MTSSAPRAYLESLDRFGMRLGLERMHALLAALGHPEQTLDAIHVVGTNGKSSTTAFTAAALRANGLRTGAYLSPHTRGFEERVQVDGAPVSATLFDRHVDRIRQAAPAVEREVGEGPTQFEALTAVGLSIFAEAGVDACVVEAGLGGRLDSTNVLGARVVGLTNVSLDHTALLGDSREAILAEKLGVVTPGALVLCGLLDDDLMARAAQICHAAGALGIRRVRPLERDTAGLRGRFQRANAALALALAAVFVAPETLDADAAWAALPAATPPGRLELDAGAPPILRDGAHNPDGMAALVAELDDQLGPRRPRVAVVGMQEDKPAQRMLALLAPEVDELIATSSGHRGALTAAEVARAADGVGVRAVAFDDPDAALERAVQRAGPDGAVLVAGSLYLLGRLAGAPRALRSPSAAVSPREERVR
jgi:dihydrofolate synthase / folylpolyglutamate synthase